MTPNINSPKKVQHFNRNKDSLWVRDVSVEKEVAKFLDKYFYHTAVNEFIRYQDKRRQLQGKDVRFSWDKLENIIVDEKVQSQYINKNLPTFAFEISSWFSGKRSEGWLFNPEKLTEYYLCIWIWAKRSWNPSSDDITKLDCLLIKRQDIIDYLKKEGFSKEKILKREKEIIKSGIKGPIDKRKHSFIYFYKTNRLAEKPFNVIIRKNKLVELSTRHFVVTKEGFEIL